ncbi:MAG TPA: AEC family transporter [Deltaproteobacteria bacterium]|nr:AEC family transporter [Deltaproteobacteria bacterium]
MDVFLTTFTAVAMLLTIGIMGYWMLSRRVIAGSVLGPLSVLAIDIALPCLTFTGILSNFHPEENTSWWTLPLWWLGSTVLFLFLSSVFSLVAKPEYRREFRVSLLFQNGIFFPLAIIAGMYGTNSTLLVELFLFTLFYPAFFFNAAPLFFSKGIKMDPAKVFNPVLVATVLAVVLRLAGLETLVPRFLSDGLKVVGAMAVPLLMLVLGGNIYIDMRESGRPAYLENLKFILLKNLVFPLATLGVLLLVRPPYPVAFIIMMHAAVPPVTAIPIIVEREGGNRGIVNQFMVASFLFSLASLPAMLMVFSWFFSP